MELNINEYSLFHNGAEIDCNSTVKHDVQLDGMHQAQLPLIRSVWRQDFHNSMMLIVSSCEFNQIQKIRLITIIEFNPLVIR